jgi:hypothetical protein
LGPFGAFWGLRRRAAGRGHSPPLGLLLGLLLARRWIGQRRGAALHWEALDRPCWSCRHSLTLTPFVPFCAPRRRTFYRLITRSIAVCSTRDRAAVEVAVMGWSGAAGAVDILNSWPRRHTSSRPRRPRRWHTNARSGRGEGGRICHESAIAGHSTITSSTIPPAACQVVPPTIRSRCWPPAGRGAAEPDIILTWGRTRPCNMISGFRRAEGRRTLRD